VTTASPAPTRVRWWPIALLVIALALFVGVFFWVGGIDGVRSMLGMRPGEPTKPASAASVPASATVPSASLAAAKIVYAEQIESQEMVHRLANGEATALEVLSTKADDESAIAQVRVTFRSGVRVRGTVRLVKSDGVWYFVTLTRSSESKILEGFDPLKPYANGSWTDAVDTELEEAGVTDPDTGVLQTIAQQQLANQPVMLEVVSGKPVRYDFGNVVKGPKTFTIPVTNHTDATASPGRIVIIAKTVEGVDRLFITTLKYDN